MHHEEFSECPTCVDKPGNPTLCESCRHNQAVIHKLSQEVRRLDRTLDTIAAVLEIGR